VCSGVASSATGAMNVRASPATVRMCGGVQQRPRAAEARVVRQIESVCVERRGRQRCLGAAHSGGHSDRAPPALREPPVPAVTPPPRFIPSRPNAEQVLCLSSESKLLRYGRLRDVTYRNECSPPTVRHIVHCCREIRRWIFCRAVYAAIASSDGGRAPASQQSALSLRLRH